MKFFLVFLLVYGTANIYLGLRNLAWIRTFFSVPPLLYWFLLFAIASSPILPRILAQYGIGGDAKNLVGLGDWWLAVTYWSVLLWLAVDILRALVRHFDILPAPLQSLFWQGLFIQVVLIAMLGFGYWNAQHPVLTRHEVTITTKVAQPATVKAVMVSDIHVGRIIGSPQLEKLAQRIQDLKPDIVFYVGDVIDDDTAYVAEHDLLAIFSTVTTPLGSYAVLGNHEYIGGRPDEARRLMEQAGIRTLRDEALLIGDSFYLIGRDDLSLARFTGTSRQSLADLMGSLDEPKPVIVLDHQPGAFQEALESGADLQLSGHSHRGQFFPNSLITKAMYVIDWGYLKRDNLHFIVSSGYGTWGPPIRLGTKGELVEITLHLRSQEDKQ